jgi:hypothetical protein
MEEGARLIRVAAEAQQLYERYGLVERREFLKSILADVKVRDGKALATGRPSRSLPAWRLRPGVRRPSAARGAGVRK